ncbi:MAG: TIGR02265 family protein [Myxococcota bacterium]
MSSLTSTLKWRETEALAARRDLCTASDTIRGMFITNALECVRRVVSPVAVTEIEAELGIKEKPAMLAKVPMRSFIEVQMAAAKRMAPVVGSPEDALARIGGASLEIFFDSIAGKTMKLLAGDDPQRLLSAAPNGYQFAVTFGSRSYEKTGPRSGVFTLERELLGPCHTLGTFDAAIFGVHGMHPDMKVEQSDVATFKILVSW